PEDPLQIGAVHGKILGKHIAYAAGNFATQYYAPVAIFHLVIFNNDIFGGDSETTAILIAARFYGDTVITGIKVAVFDPYIFARLGIHPVIIRTERLNSDIINCYILA